MEEEEVVAVVGNYVMMEHGDGYKNPVHMIRFAKATTAMPPHPYGVAKANIRWWQQRDNFGFYASPLLPGSLVPDFAHQGA